MCGGPGAEVRGLFVGVEVEGELVVTGAKLRWGSLR